MVVISHAFTNWRLGESSSPWRWALLPELYARWRKRIRSRFPQAYHGNRYLDDLWVRNAAESICAAVPDDNQHVARRLIEKLAEETPWPGALDAGEYGRDQNLRPWLERAVGLGLGVFDLIIIDEAHKSRGTEAGLSRLIENVVLCSNKARRLAMTATPVELDVGQWRHTLSRIGLGEESVAAVGLAIDGYAKAVERLRQAWRSSPEAREDYESAARTFENALKPYLLRRDKREDPAVGQFVEHSGLSFESYRQESEITVELSKLSPAWRQAVCAVEALSVTVRNTDDPVAKRLRLTIANGHGITALLDQIKRDEEQDRHQENHDQFSPKAQPRHAMSGNDHKRKARAQWWLANIKRAFADTDAPLFYHPAILAAVAAIEGETERHEKVLVFGRFTRPLRALVDLLNAREMLRRLESGKPWPQAKVHGDKAGDADTSEWPAVRAAYRQLKSRLTLDELDGLLEKQYGSLSYRREKLRKELVPAIQQGLEKISASPRMQSLMVALDRSAKNHAGGDSDERHPVALVSRAITELLGDSIDEFKPCHYAQAFVQLIEAVSDRDDPDADPESSLHEGEAAIRWEEIEGRLHEEYNRPQGGFARLMYGGTKPESRRMIQLAFNRPNSFPKVLVAQSMVGREGLNLHEACRIVVMLHPEWNPGVVEQQIGRVDRVGSHWGKELEAAIQAKASKERLPRIEIRPVIFSGTYDEHNWRVLRERWDNLRAQLHGIVVPTRAVSDDPEGQRILDEISKAAPSFSPNRGS